MEVENNIEKLISNLKDYAETRYTIGVLTAQSKTASILSILAVATIVGVLAVLVLLFISIGVAWMIGDYFHQLSLGFLIVAGFYLLVAIIILLNREKWIMNPILNGFIKSVNSKVQE